jgi:hypothetical protein
MAIHNLMTFLMDFELLATAPNAFPLAPHSTVTEAKIGEDG